MITKCNCSVLNLRTKILHFEPILTQPSRKLPLTVRGSRAILLIKALFQTLQAHIAVLGQPYGPEAFFVHQSDNLGEKLRPILRCHEGIQRHS